MTTLKVFVLGKTATVDKERGHVLIAWLQNTDMARTGAREKKKGAPQAPFEYL